MNKKGFEMTLGLVVTAVILLITVFVVIGSFTNIWAKGTGEIRSSFDANKDADGDGIINAFDKCPCGSASDQEKFQGCSSESSIPKTPETIKTTQKCLNEKK